MGEKVCRKCSQALDTRYYQVRCNKKRGTSHVSNICVFCEREYARLNMKDKYQKKGPRQPSTIDEEYAIQYHERKARANSSSVEKEKRPVSNDKNREAKLERSKKYKQENKDKVNATRRKYTAIIMQDPIQRLKRNIKCQLLCKIRKTAPSSTYFGVNVNFIKSWLEFNFADEMTWSNYGSYWQIDHTIAIHLWDLTCEDEQHACFNWKNMMPLEKQKNAKKSAQLVPIRVLLQEQRLRQFFHCRQLPQEELLEYVHKYSEKYKSLLPEFFMRHAQIAGNP